ncbi:MAG: hypothetical protein M1835_004613 [Candelina submexicana]|nr:MAG: hypothetical protein M1835_004613 [Candelina submexicana]
MHPSKKRKVTTTVKRRLPLSKQQHGIQSFGRISKAQALSDVSRTDKERGTVITVSARQLKKEPTETNGKKRKFATIEDEKHDELVEKEELHVLQEFEANVSDTVCQSALVKSASEGGVVEGEPENNERAGSHIRFDQPARSSLPPVTPSTSLCESSATLSSSPPIPDELAESNDHPLELPEELLDMINLHSAFLTALSLHYAHNGSLIPVDLRLLSPSIERIWRKRKVKVEDIRRLMGVLDMPLQDGPSSSSVSSDCELKLLNYGAGKVCIEMRECPQKGGIVASQINEDKLSARFVSKLNQCWWCRKQLSAATNRNRGGSDIGEGPVRESTSVSVSVELVNYDCVQEFISKLPMAPIIVCSSLSKILPTLAKGQRRLEDLKASAVIGKEKTMRRQLRTAASSSSKTTRDRGQGLVERIRAKELYQSTLPLPPPKASLARVSAFQRLEEIIQVLNVLSNSKNNFGKGDECIGQRISFTLPTLLQILQNSLRNPISSEEAALCMRLLAQEVAPGWITVAVMGGVTGVVVQKGRRPDMVEIQSTIKRCMQ